MDDWKRKAAIARDQLRNARRGEKDLVLLQLAEGMNPNTLRRAIFAADYLDEVAKSAPRLRADLEPVALSLIEILARWRSFDPKGAAKIAKEVVKGKHSVTTLSEAMATAKKEGGVGFEPSYRDMIAGAALDAIRGVLDGDIASDEGAEQSLSEPVDFQYIRMIGKPPRFESVVGVIVGPYADSKIYAKRRLEWLQRSLGLAWMYHHVVLLLPHLPELESYRSLLSESLARIGKLGREEGPRSCSPSVFVLHPSPSRGSSLTDEEDEALGSLKD